MAITYGFFNSVNGDRKYNAEDIGRFLQGIITSGVFADSTSSLQVLAGEGMQVTVQAGRAMLDCHYMNNDSPLTLTLSNGATQDRIDAIVARLDLTNRLCEIAIKEGTPAAAPVVPTLARTDVKKEYMLASVYVTKLTTAITQENITDTRANTAVCGWVTGLLDNNIISVPIPAKKFALYIPTVNADGTGYELMPTDTTLSFDGAVADAAKTGQGINEAKAAAVAAQSTANTAKTNAATAQSTADSAASAAAAAQSTANAAKTNAATAQSTADTAKTNAANAKAAADKAQSTADTAKTNAATAQSTANAAKTAATTAQSTADTAKTAAAAALPKAGGTMTGQLKVKGLVLTSGTDYGTTLPAAGTPGRIFFKKVT